MIRAFVAVELPDELKKTIAQVQAQIKGRIAREIPPEARIQWVRPDSMHLTLKFLGDIEETQVESIRQALASRVMTVPGFLVEVGSLGVFPDLRMPRVFWVGLSDQPGHLQGLLHLAEQVETSLETLGFLRESRPFNPHLTLARIKERSREVGKVLSDSGILKHETRLGSLPVERVSLMRSDLKPSGAVYTKLWEIPLGQQG
jgi:2'-5' RNA ligase